MIKRNLIILLLIFIFSACYIEIKENVGNPEPYLQKAIKEAERAERDSFWKGRASSLNIFVYDKESKDIVKVSVPIWFFNLCVDIAEDFSHEPSKDFRIPSNWDCDFDFHALKKLSKLGPGLLMEVKGENSLILIWMR